MSAILVASRGVRDATGAIAAIGRAEWLALPLYAILTLIAIRPESAGSTVGLIPLQVEGFVMTDLVFFGIMFAWALFTEPSHEGTGRAA